MKKIVLIIALFALGCTPQHEKISEAEVIKTVEGFFIAMNEYYSNGNNDVLVELVTDDFMQQSNKRRNMEEFFEALSSNKVLEWNYDLSEYRITTGNSWAHISFLNKGKWTKPTDSVRLLNHYAYLETALLLMEEGSLKINFYSNTPVLFESKPIE